MFFHVGEGKVSVDHANDIDRNEYLHHVHSHESLLRSIYENIKEKHSDKECIKNRTILATGNTSLQILNKIMGAKSTLKAITIPSSGKIK